MAFIGLQVARRLPLLRDIPPGISGRTMKYFFERPVEGGRLTKPASICDVFNALLGEGFVLEPIHRRHQSFFAQKIGETGLATFHETLNEPNRCPELMRNRLKAQARVIKASRYFGVQHFKCLRLVGREGLKRTIVQNQANEALNNANELCSLVIVSALHACNQLRQRHFEQRRHFVVLEELFAIRGVLKRDILENLRGQRQRERTETAISANRFKTMRFAITGNIPAASIYTVRAVTNRYCQSARNDQFQEKVLPVVCIDMI